MFFSVRDLEVKKIHFETEYPAGEIDFLDPGVEQYSVLKTRGVAELLSNTLGEIRVKGHLDVTIQAACDRCLEPAQFPVDSDFDLFYRPVESGVLPEEARIDDGELEIAFYEEGGVALKDVLREFVLLAMPMRKLCREDCRGICPLCGSNRNLKECRCEENPVDSRWAALKNI